MSTLDLSATIPTPTPEPTFAELFDLAEMQCLQDRFAAATGVASLITLPDGTPLTAPSRFCVLCRDIIRQSEKGGANCLRSDVLIGRFNPDGPTVQPCLSGGLWDAGACIIVDGRHLANWFIGQVRNEAQDESAMLAYAREIGVDPQRFITAFRDVPVMSQEQFQSVADALFVFANELSEKAWLNFQQRQLIAQQREIEQLLQEEAAFNEAQARLGRALTEQSGDLPKMARTVHDVVLAVTGSRFGYVASIDPKTGDLVSHTLSSMMGDERCQVPDGTIRFPKGIDGYAGLWGHALNSRTPFFTNSADRHASARGLPTGHVPIERFLSVPCLCDGELVGQIALANKSHDYTDKDLERIVILADLFAVAIMENRTRQSLASREAVLSSRVRMMEKAPALTIAEIHQMTLDEAERLTGSSIGFFHQYDEESKSLTLSAWSTRTQAEFCQVPGSDIHYGLDQAGVWADCLRQRGAIIHNDLSVVPNRKGMPEGHAVVSRELCAPVFRSGKIVGVLGLGNKPTPYSAQDLNIAAQLADLAWDIIARKMAEDNLIAARDDANNANRAKSEFLANMSHELRTPINGIIGTLQLLEASPLEGEQREFVSMAKQAGTGLLDLIKDILDLSTIEAGRLTLEVAPFDPGAVLHACYQTLQSVADGKSIALRLDLGQALPAAVLGDVVRVRQILFNLLGNAIKFTPAGEVYCAVRAYVDPAGTHRLEYIVRDTGIGISADQLSRIFEPFAQVEGTYRRQYQGAGLGLSIVKKLVDIMAGEIAVDSQPGIGTSFTVTIPAEPVKEMKNEAPQVSLSTGLPNRKKILIAEDNQINQTILRRMLEKSGFQVVVANDGQQALQALSAQPVDLVFMDIQMPKMDGVEATRAIRAGKAGEHNRTLPIIATTAYSMNGDREKFLEERMDDYLSKPIVWEDLNACLAKYFDTKTA